MKKVLSVALRPTKLEDVVGQEESVQVISKQFETKRIPHFYLITGPTGSGKTTFSRIIANMLGGGSSDIMEINASDKNGIDDIREIISKLNYKPIYPSSVKVVIWDEAHQITTAAQNALLKTTEDTPESSFIIFCTSNETKIIPALKRRAYILQTREIDDNSIRILVKRAKEYVGFTGDTEYFENKMIDEEIRSPGIILQHAEKFFSGQSINIEKEEENIDTKKLCNLVSKEDWNSCLPILKNVKKENVIMLRMCITGYLKTVLLNSKPEKAVLIAKAILKINTDVYDDNIAVFLSNLCIATLTIK